MGRTRDIAAILSKTEADNTGNLTLLNTSSETGLDSAQVTTIATDAGIAVYTALDSLPSSGLSSGDQAWVESSGRLYISNGSGWYNIALVNASPTLTLDQSGTIQLNADTLTVTVIASATDSDDNQDIITFSVESDGNMVGTGTTISQDSSVFTITADSEGGNGVAGNFTLTFKATDGIAVDNEALSFSLSFSTIVDSSAETILLMKADSNNVGNTTIKYIDSAESESTWTTTGTVTASSFSPYRSGGYSTYFGGTTDRIYTGSSSDFDLDTNDWCYEGWFYVPSGHSFVSYPRLMGLGAYYNTPQSFGVMARDADQSDYISAYWGDGGSNASRKLISSTTWDKGQWNHVACVRKGGAIALYYNGTRIANNASYGTSTDIGSGNTYAYVGHTGSNTEGTNMYFRDVRLVNGSSIYDPADTSITVPTEALTAVTNTKLLVGATPYIADISSSEHTLTLSGVDGTYPFSPYDYSPWNDSDHGGSIYFNGEGNYLSHTAPSDIQTLGRQNQSMTIEAWIRPTGAPTQYAYIYGIGTNGSTAGSNLYGLEIGTNYQLRGAVNGAYTTAVGMPLTANNVITPNAWNHVALVQNAGNWTIYVNGISKATQGNTSYMSGTTHSTGFVGRSHYDDNRYWPGYVSNLRIHDTAIYTSAFTPPTSPVTTPKLLLNQAGANANIYDAAAGNVFTLVGNTQSSTTQRKWTGSSAIVFDGSGDRIDIDTDNFGRLAANEPFTLEGWYRFNDITGQALFHFTDTPGTLNDLFYVSSTSNASFYANGGEVTSNSGGGISLNTWHHIAMTRHTDNKIRIFVDGTLKDTSSGTYADLVPRYLEIGRYASTTAQLDGYIQDVRITKGRARYTASFTPPTAEFEL